MRWRNIPYKYTQMGFARRLLWVDEIGMEIAAQEIECLTEELDIHKHNIVNYSHFIAATID